MVNVSSTWCADPDAGHAGGFGRESEQHPDLVTGETAACRTSTDLINRKLVVCGDSGCGGWSPNQTWSRSFARVHLNTPP